LSGPSFTVKMQNLVGIDLHRCAISFVVRRFKNRVGIRMLQN
jgi:hypothetical protein